MYTKCFWTVRLVVSIVVITISMAIVQGGVKWKWQHFLLWWAYHLWMSEQQTWQDVNANYEDNDEALMAHLIVSCIASPTTTTPLPPINQPNKQNTKRHLTKYTNYSSASATHILKHCLVLLQLFVLILSIISIQAIMLTEVCSLVNHVKSQAVNWHNKWMSKYPFFLI